MIKIAITDDDNDVCKSLKNFLTKYSMQKNADYLIKTFCACEELLHEIRTNSGFDMIFLDIEFKDMNGIELGDFIRNELMDEETAIIFISAVEGYSMQLFRIHPFDFIIKPLDFEKVKQCMDSYFKTYYLKNKYFRFSRNKSEHEVAVSQIKFFKSSAKKIYIYTNHEIIEFYGQLSDCVDQECTKNFIIIHQSYIVNPIYIDKFGFDYVIVKDGIQLPISRLRQKEVREQLLNL